MADTVQINFGVDVSGAIAPINQLKSAIAGLGAPLAAMGTASADAAALQRQAMEQTTREALDAARRTRQIDADYLAAFKTTMQVMVDRKQLTLQQALGYDIDYTAQLHDQEALRLAAVLGSDQATGEDRRRVLAELIELDARYAVQSAADFRRAAEAARAEADRVARSYEEAFDRLGSSVSRTFNEIFTRQITWTQGMTRMIQQVETFFLEEVEKMAAHWAASGLASLAGGAVASAVGAAQGTGASGLGAGLTALVGIGQQGGLFGTGLLSGAGAVQATAITANTTALTASTTALTALTAALTGATAAESTAAGASLAGGGAAVAAGGGGLFSWLAGLFAFGKGGIVPSAAGGWAVPNLAGAMPALVHAREMVLPADISQGLQGMIAGGGGGGAHFHAHFHGPADAPSISRWFRDNLKSNAGAIRDLFRQNALTPRSF